MLARLDDQGSQRYLPDQDILPAINSGISRTQGAFGWALANRKGSEEAMREFTRIAVFQTSSFGAINIGDAALGHTMANVLAVYPQPLTEQTQTITPNTASLVRSDLTFAGPTTPCQRVTHEMVPMIRNNSSMRGNEVLAANDSRRSWAYYLNAGVVNLLPKSQAASIIAAVAYIQKFENMTSTTSTVNLPPFMADILADWALYYISVKQDTQGQGVGNFAAQDAAQLFGFSVN
jgi:hypothetical protein